MISKEYLFQLQNIFKDKTRPNGFGGKIKKLGEFHNLIKLWKPKTLLDYGCGKGIILNYLQNVYPDIQIHGYDPAVSQYSNVQLSKYDCVFSNDVLEHVEQEYINQVLHHIDSLSTNHVWLRIDLLPARKTLPDGRNAHILLKPEGWWTNKLLETIHGDIIYKSVKKGKLDIAIKKWQV